MALIMAIGKTAIAQDKKKKDTLRTPVQWKPIRDNDMLWKKRVWRQIEVYYSKNAVLRPDPNIPDENV